MGLHVPDVNDVLIFSILSTSTTSQSGTLTALSTIPQATPMLYLSDGKYQLLGCYNELSSTASGIALGQDGYFVSPEFESPEDFTVGSGLKVCNIATTPDGVLGFLMQQ